MAAGRARVRFPISRQEPRYHQRSFAGHARGSPPPSRRGHATPSTGRPDWLLDILFARKCTVGNVKAAPVDLHRGGPPDEGPGRPTIQRMTGRAYADDLSAALGRSGRTVVGHLSRDSTAIEAREKPAAKEKAPAAQAQTGTAGRVRNDRRSSSASSAVADAPSAPRESRRRLAGEPGACGRLHRMT